MPSLKHITSQIELIKVIDEIAGALGDIATIRLRQTRRLIEHNISFFQEISEVYSIVRYQAQVKSQSLLTRANNGKTLAVLITANNRLYGGLDSILTRFYAHNTKSLACDRLIIGLSGQDLLTSINYPYKFTPLSFKDNSPNFAELKQIANFVYNYKTILVFHTKFVSVLDQVPTVSDISNFELKQPKQIKDLYLLEPELKEMIHFFESQLSILLLQAIFTEVDLARLAARMNAMNQAEENARKALDLEKKGLLKYKRLRINLESIRNYVSLKNLKIGS